MPTGVSLPIPEDKTMPYRIIKELMKKPGDPVEQGDILLTFEDEDQLGKVISPAAGTLKAYHCTPGNKMPFHSDVCTITETGKADTQPDEDNPEDDEEKDTSEAGDDPKAAEPEPVIEYGNPIDKIKNQLELITQKNMIVQVSEHILKKCDEDFEFYEKVHNPKKSLENCIKYINNQAKKLCEEMVKLNGNNPGGTQSIAIEGDRVFTWAVEYFDKDNLTEDGYRAPKASKSKGKKGKNAPATNAPQKSEHKKADSEQQSLF